MLFGTEISPQYLRGRLRAFMDLYDREPAKVVNKNNPGKAYLRNGADGYKTEELEQLTAIYAQGESNEPLTFTELCSLNTWFKIHPEKVAGVENLTTSLHFPVTIKGNREDVERVLGAETTTPNNLDLEAEAVMAMLELLELEMNLNK